MKEGTTRAVISPLHRKVLPRASCNGRMHWNCLVTEGANSLERKRQDAALAVPHPRVSFAYFEGPCH